MMRKYGLIGYPLGHSFSKRYFAEKFLRENISDCSYENYPVKSITLLPGLVSEEPELSGLNVTIPYKTEVMRYLSQIDEEAAGIGAVNVLKIFREAGEVRISGFNSDIKGISDSLISIMRPEVNKALILGTGGSSRAVSYTLGKMGINCSLVSRRNKPGCLTYKDLTPELIRETLLIINTTPLGMFPDIDSYPDLDYSLLGKSHILFDLVYNPETTIFMRKGQERGCTVLNGLKMLVSQAERSWEIWNDDSL